MDRVDGNLLLGNTQFNFTVSFDNGIQSIDLMKLNYQKIQMLVTLNGYRGAMKFLTMLVVSSNHLGWNPNKGGKPILGMFTSIWMRWDLESKHESNIPSLRLFDENAPLDALSLRLMY